MALHARRSRKSPGFLSQFVPLGVAGVVTAELKLLKPNLPAIRPATQRYWFLAALKRLVG
jgi:hypothetical protein